jgi:hypothetical protein
MEANRNTANINEKRHIANRKTNKNAVFWDMAPCSSSVNRSSSEKSLQTRSTRRHISENGIIHSHRRENLKSCTEKLITCEIVFHGLANRSVNIFIEMPLAENNIRYRAVINRNYCYRRELRKRDI